MTTAFGTIQQHNERPSAVWSSGGSDYDEISRGIADAIEHCVLRLNPQPGERIPRSGPPPLAGLAASWRDGAPRSSAPTSRAICSRQRGAPGARTGDWRSTIRWGTPKACRLRRRRIRRGDFHPASCLRAAQEAAAAELARVCRKGGRIALTTWDPDGTIGKMFEVMRRYMPAPPTPAPRSPFEWGRVDRVRELLGSRFMLRFEKAVFAITASRAARSRGTRFSKGYGPTRALATSLDTADRRDALRRTTSSPFTRAFEPSSASACRATTC